MRLCQPPVSVMSPVAAGDTAPLVEGRLSLYEASTQFRNWRYSGEQLAHIRGTLNEAAVAVIRNTFEADEVLALCSYTTACCALSLVLARIIAKCGIFECR